MGRLGCGEDSCQFQMYSQACDHMYQSFNAGGFHSLVKSVSSLLSVGIKVVWGIIINQRCIVAWDINVNFGRHSVGLRYQCMDEAMDVTTGSDNTVGTEVTGHSEQWAVSIVYQ